MLYIHIHAYVYICNCCYCYYYCFDTFGHDTDSTENPASEFLDKNFGQRPVHQVVDRIELLMIAELLKQSRRSILSMKFGN